MKPLALNMSAFRKIAQDKHTSTLENSAGHTITVAHKALPREQRSLLNALPLYAADHADPVQDKQMSKGGKVPDLKFGSKKAPKEENQKLSQAMGRRIEPKKFDGGGSVWNQNSLGQEQAQQAADAATEKAQVDQLAAMHQPYDKSPDETPQAADAPPPIQNAVETPAQVTQPTSPATPNVQPIERNIGSAPQPPGEPTPDPMSGAGHSPNFTAGYNQALSGGKELNEAQANLEAENAQHYQKQIAAQDDLLKTFNDKTSWIDSQRGALSQEIQDGHISPEHYWDNHSKMAAGLGIILAGFNPTNNPNAAIDFLKSNIERDTQAQIAEMGKKTTLLGHYSKMFGDVQDGVKFVNAVKTDQVANQLKAAAANMAASNPMRAGLFNKYAGDLQMNAAKELPGIAMKQAGMQAIQNGHDPGAIANAWRMMGNEGMANSIDKKNVPGIGLAQVDVTPEVRGKLVSHQQLDNTLNELSKFAANNKGAIFRGDVGAIQEGRELAMKAQQALREGQLNTIYRESEKPLLEKMLSSDPTSLLSDLTMQHQIKQIRKSNGEDLNILKGSVGLPKSEMQQSSSGGQSQGLTSQQQALLQQARANPNHPNSAKVIKALGGG